MTSWRAYSRQVICSAPCRTQRHARAARARARVDERCKTPLEPRRTDLKSPSKSLCSLPHVVTCVLLEREREHFSRANATSKPRPTELKPPSKVLCSTSHAVACVLLDHTREHTSATATAKLRRMLLKLHGAAMTMPLRCASESSAWQRRSRGPGGPIVGGDSTQLNSTQQATTPIDSDVNMQAHDLPAPAWPAARPPQPSARRSVHRGSSRACRGNCILLYTLQHDVAWEGGHTRTRRAHTHPDNPGLPRQATPTGLLGAGQPSRPCPYTGHAHHRSPYTKHAQTPPTDATRPEYNGRAGGTHERARRTGERSAQRPRRGHRDAGH